MPGFSVTLSERERWDVVSYAMSLGTPESLLAEGEHLYSDHCAECHGESGAGDGVRAAGLETQPRDWREPSTLTWLSLDELRRVSTNGVPPSMPAFGDSLKGEQLLAVSAYIRRLGYATPSETMVELPTLAEKPESGAKWLTVKGAAQTPDGVRAPAGLPAFLEGYDGFQLTWNSATTLDEEGQFTFTDVPLAAGRIYFARVDYQGLSFYSNAIRPDEINALEIERLMVLIYPASNDPSRLYIERLHVFFDYVDQDSLQVVQMFNIANPDPLVIIPEAGSGVLNFHLPPGASNLQFQDEDAGNRYILTEDGFMDTGSIPPAPKKHQVIFGFNLPYQKKLDFALPLELPVGSILVAVPANGVQVISDQLMESGTRVIEGGTLRLYEGGRLRAGETLKMVLSNLPGSSWSMLRENNDSTIAGILVLFIVLLFGGTWLQRKWKRWKEAGNSGRSSVELMDAILALDDQYQAGKLQEDGYLVRRSGLKTQLRNALDRENKSLQENKH